MDRRLFIYRFARWAIVIILAGITFLLRHKINPGSDCSSCPEYASCSGLDNCTVNPKKS